MNVYTRIIFIPGIANGSRNGSQANLPHHVQIQEAPAIESNPLPVNSNPAVRSAIPQQQSAPHHGAIGQPVPAAAAPQGQINPNQLSDQSLGRQFQQQLSFGQQQPVSQSQSQATSSQLRATPVMNSGTHHHKVEPTQPVNQQQPMLNNLSATAPAAAPVGVNYNSAAGTDSVRPKFTQNGNPSAAVGAGIGIGELDDFVIDDDMFQSSEQPVSVSAAVVYMTL